MSAATALTAWLRSAPEADDALGKADCEAIGDGLLAQPVATLSSAAFVVGAAVLLVVWARSREDSLVAWVYSILLATVGLTSAAYHGPQWGLSEFAHDATIAAALAIAVLVPVLRAIRRGPPWPPAPRWLYVVLLASGVAAGGAYWLGRTGSRACDPDSLLQWHAVWHLGSATLLTVWALILWPPLLRRNET